MFLVPFGCTHSDPRLSGTWKSNLELTTQYNKEHANLSKNQEMILSQLFGIMEITFQPNNTCELYFPKHNIQTEKKRYEHDESRSFGTYKLLFKDDKLAVVVFEDDKSDKSVSVLTFVDDKTYWVYVGYSDRFDLHLREYFTKQE